jgi:hypothetical protein
VINAAAVVGFLQSYNGAVTAVATVFIGVFTLVLVIVTRRQAILTKQSVQISERALTDLERAYIYVEKISSDVPIYLSPTTAWAEDRHGPRFTFSVINFGRTSGNIQFAVLIFEVKNTLPAAPTRLRVMYANPDAESVEIIIGPDRPYEFPEMKCTGGFTHAHVEEMKAGTSHLYCHGFFTYIDIFGKSHTTKFCRRYWVERDEWPPIGGRERNSAD